MAEHEKLITDLKQKIEKKKSEIDKLTHGEQSINNCTIFGKGAKERGHALERKVYGKGTN